MKLRFVFLFALINFLAYAQLPDGFTYVKDKVPNLLVDLKYYGNDNFVGRQIDGYTNDCLILTEETILALKQIQAELKTKNLGLKVFDGYRPQRAVDHFIRWAKDLNDTINKARFYPDVKKSNLFKEDYIASRSSHSKGSTVDVTLVNLTNGEALDMGSDFDFFGVQSWVSYDSISAEQKNNRKLLQTTMLKYGFKNYSKEWWHFTLKDEPFPNTYFDFLIE